MDLVNINYFAPFFFFRRSFNSAIPTTVVAFSMAASTNIAFVGLLIALVGNLHSNTFFHIPALGTTNAGFCPDPSFPALPYACAYARACGTCVEGSGAGPD